MKQFAIFAVKASVEKALKVEKELKQIDENFAVERTSSPAQVWATAPDYWPYGDSRFAAAEKIMARHFGVSSAAAALGSIKSPKKAASSRENGKLGGRPKYATTLHSDGTVTYWSVYRQAWVRRVDIGSIPDAELAAMSSTERDKILSRR